MRMYSLAVHPPTCFISSYSTNFDNIFATLNTLARTSNLENLFTLQENCSDYDQEILMQIFAIWQQIVAIATEN
jgi:hypothetical protein